MKDDNQYGDNGKEQAASNPEIGWPSRDGLFRYPENDEEFEEPDRDSDYASVFTEVEEEEADLPDEEGTAWQTPEDDAATEPADEGQASDRTWAAIASLVGEERAAGAGTGVQFDGADQAWEDDAYEGEDSKLSLPLGMLAVGVIALVLLGLGGYGVMRDRADLEEEIRQLQGSLATAASPAEVARVRAASETLAERNRALEQQVSDLIGENQGLEAIIGGLETQLQAQQETLAKAAAPPPAAAPRPAPAKAAAAAPVVAAKPDAGSWFVNFGSYTQRSTAQSWADRLQPGAGDVVVSTGDKDGRTFYRVRVINLGSEELANATARQLEQDHGLSRLWVGQNR